MPDLDLPAHLSPGRAAALHELADRNDAEHGEGFLGLVLSGSAGRGMATERSDLDVLVVLTDDAAAGRRTTRALDLLERTLDGDPRAVRETFVRVERAADAHPAAEELTALLDGWGDQLDLLRVS